MTRNFGVRKRTVIEEIAPDIAAAIGPAALAELAAISLFLMMVLLWYGVIL